MTINYYGNLVDIKFDTTDSSGAPITDEDGNEYNVIPSDQFK